MLDLNCAVVACVTSIFVLLMLAYCWGYYWLIVVHPAKQLIEKFFSIDSRFYSSFLFPVIKWFFCFEKYKAKNTTWIQHVYTTRWYNWSIQPVQHSLLQHEAHMIRLFNNLIQHDNAKVVINRKMFSKNKGGKG